MIKIDTQIIFTFRSGSVCVIIRVCLLNTYYMWSTHHFLSVYRTPLRQTFFSFSFYSFNIWEIFIYYVYHVHLIKHSHKYLISFIYIFVWKIRLMSYNTYPTTFSTFFNVCNVYKMYTTNTKTIPPPTPLCQPSQ